MQKRLRYMFNTIQSGYILNLQGRNKVSILSCQYQSNTSVGINDCQYLLKGKQVCAEYISGAVWGMLQAASLSNNVRCQKSFQFVVNINHSRFHCMLNIPVFINSRFMSFVMICILHETSPHLLMKASASRLVNFLLEPLLAIINNKQVEPISSASSSSCLQSDWMA